MLFLPGGDGVLSSQAGVELPLLVQEHGWQKSPTSIVEDLLIAADVRSAGQEFACSSVQVSTSTEIVNVIQGEVAVAKPGSGPSALGSDSATTCHIVGFRNPVSGATCLAHLDNWRTAAEATQQMLQLMTKFCEESTAPLDVYIVGGYLGEQSGEQLSQALLSALHASRQVFRVVLACISWINSRPLEVENTTRMDDQLCALTNSSVAASSSLTRNRATPGTGGDVECKDGRAEVCGADQVQAELMRDYGRGDLDSAEGMKYHKGLWLPRQTSLAIDVTSGRAFAVRFEGAGRGPGWQIRSLRVFASPQREPLTKEGLVTTLYATRLETKEKCLLFDTGLRIRRPTRNVSHSWSPRRDFAMQVYDAQNDRIIVAPFPFRMNREAMLQLLRLPDKELLAATSTSPEAEDERFLADIRSNFSYALATIGPDGTGWGDKVFRGGGGKPLEFRREDGAIFLRSEGRPEACERLA